MKIGNVLLVVAAVLIVAIVVVAATVVYVGGDSGDPVLQGALRAVRRVRRRPPDARDVVRVFTLNTWTLPFAFLHSPARKDARVATLIRDIPWGSADVVALQEVWGSASEVVRAGWWREARRKQAFADAGRAQGLPVVSIPPPPHLLSGSGVSFTDGGLVTLARGSARRRHFFPFSRAWGDDALAEKGAQLTTVHLPQLADPVDVWNVHLQATYSCTPLERGEPHLEAQLVQLRELAALVAEWSSGSPHVLLVGDWNADAELHPHAYGALLSLFPRAEGWERCAPRGPTHHGECGAEADDFAMLRSGSLRFERAEADDTLDSDHSGVLLTFRVLRHA